MNSRTRNRRVPQFESIEARALLSADGGITLVSPPAQFNDIDADGIAQQVVDDIPSLPPLTFEPNDGGPLMNVWMDGWLPVGPVDSTVSNADLLPGFSPQAGDANSDGQFDSSDLVQVFQAGKYTTGENAAWADGDFDHNAMFDPSDLIAAFQAGGYETALSTDRATGSVVNANLPGNVLMISTSSESGSRRAGHRIRTNDGGWTDEYVDFDKDGKRIGRESETYDKNGMMREHRVTRDNADGGRTTTTKTYDKDGKWTGTTTETFDKSGKQTVGTKSAPDGKGGTTTQSYDPATRTWKAANNVANVATEEAGSRKAGHRIGTADGGWTDEYVNFDKDGKRIGRESETYDKNGMMREHRVTRDNADGGRTTTTKTYDKDGKWTGTTSETFDKSGKQTGGTKSTPDGKGGTTTQTYDPTTRTWK